MSEDSTTTADNSINCSKMVPQQGHDKAPPSSVDEKQQQQEEESGATDSSTVKKTDADKHKLNDDAAKNGITDNNIIKDSKSYTNGKRKADNCILLDDSDSIENDSRPVKKLKGDSNSASSIVNGLLKSNSKKDVGYASDDSLCIDEPQALSSDTEDDTSAKKITDKKTDSQKDVAESNSNENSQDNIVENNSNETRDLTESRSSTDMKKVENSSTVNKMVQESKVILDDDDDDDDDDKNETMSVAEDDLVISDKMEDETRLPSSPPPITKDENKDILKNELNLDCKTEELSEAQLTFANDYESVYKHILDLDQFKQTPVPTVPNYKAKSRRGGSRRGGFTPRSHTPPSSSKVKGPMDSIYGGVTNATASASAGGSLPTPSKSFLAGYNNSSAVPSTSAASNASQSNNLGSKRKTAHTMFREDSPEIEVVSEKSAPPQARKEPPRKPLLPLSNMPNSAALLNILARPRNMFPVTIAVKDRKELDVMVKGSLVKTSQDFSEWLFGLRLLKDRINCPKHPNTNAIKLGLYQTASVLPSSGGYVWTVECCPGGRRYVSVYSGSIFAIALKENISATSVLKLIYHWSCQTTISNVENWVKVSRDVIGRSYHCLRCVCSVMLQDKLYDMGASGTTIELGIVSLGTTTADGAKKAVKVEILGLYDRTTESYRLYASAPQNNANSSQRFMRILKPVLAIVHHNAEIVCDYSIDKACLPVMNYKKVVFCNQNQEGTEGNTNATIMSYLRKHVPKMFQNSLSQLSLEQVQLVLDELCWRETFGRSPSHSYTNIMKQLAYLTTREADNNGLLCLLDYIAQNPHKSWRYVAENNAPLITMPPDNPPTLPTTPYPYPTPSIINRTVAPIVHPSLDVDASARTRVNLTGACIDVDPSNVINPLLHENKMVLSIINNQVHPIRNASKHRLALSSNNAGAGNRTTPSALAAAMNTTATAAQALTRPGPSNSYSSSGSISKSGQPPGITTATETVDLVSYFYGEVPGDDSVGREENSCVLTCSKCEENFGNNILFYEHIKTHLFDHRLPNMIICRYCILQFSDQDGYDVHVNEVHSVLGRESENLCRICMLSFDQQALLVNHMAEKHVEAELPYRCEVCNYSSSYYTNAVDHFVQNHKGAPYLQCHFCLMVKTIAPGNIASLTSWTLNHLLEHARGVRCNTCVLSIKNKNRKTINSHNVVHASYRQRKDLVRYTSVDVKISVTKAARLGPRCIISNPILNMRPAAAMSRLIQKTHELIVRAGSDDKCKECERPMDLDGHYTSYQSCTKCPYATCCSAMMPRHNYVFHPYNKTRKLAYSIGPAILAPQPLVCACGFTSHSGNHIARHLNTCVDSNKTAFPPLVDVKEENNIEMMDEHNEDAQHFLDFNADPDMLPDGDMMTLTPNVELQEM